MDDDIRKEIEFSLRMGLKDKTVQAHLRAALSPKCERQRKVFLITIVSESLTERLKGWKIERPPERPLHKTPG